MLYQAEFGSGREQRIADISTELERNRLQARLRSGGRHLIARGTALAMALFR